MQINCAGGGSNFEVAILRLQSDYLTFLSFTREARLGRQYCGKRNRRAHVLLAEGGETLRGSAGEISFRAPERV